MSHRNALFDRTSSPPPLSRSAMVVYSLVLAYGGGGPHCITQQVPVRDGA